MAHKKGFISGVIKAMGLVFGDIGTSPIYTLTVIFVLLKPTPENIFGIVSLIIWTLIIIVFIEYVLLAMTLNVHGEGGSLILRRIIEDTSSSKKVRKLFAMFAFVEVSLILGDGVITPSISILSAVEGIELIPAFNHVSQMTLVVIAIIIAFILFLVQSKGTDKVAGTFGPIMLIWFSCLATSGLITIAQQPSIIMAVNPYYAVTFLAQNKIFGFFMLAQVILCSTGAEAMYADMGHLGKKPIVKAWNIVFVALLLNYLGQGAFMLSHPGTKSILFGMIQNIAPVLYIPFVILTILATVIASQALISGVFSIVYQGINIGALPRLKILFTSNIIKSQIYIGMINWTLMGAVVLVLVVFKSSGNLAAAYGLAVTGSMAITGIMMSSIFFMRRQYFRLSVGVLVTIVDFAFFIANFYKIPTGGYWSLILASGPLLMIILWTNGQKRIYKNLRALDIDTFMPGYSQIYAMGKNISGKALFFVGNPKTISPYIIHCIVRSGIIYETNILMSIHRTDNPFGIETRINENLGPGLQSFEIFAGYKEEVDIGKILKITEINPKIIFYGVEDIFTASIFWKIFSFIKKISPSFVKFYKVPGEKLHGVLSRVEI
jgi:KUP system potassium uptake protein